MSSRAPSAKLFVSRLGDVLEARTQQNHSAVCDLVTRVQPPVDRGKPGTSGRHQQRTRPSFRRIPLPLHLLRLCGLSPFDKKKQNPDQTRNRARCKPESGCGRRGGGVQASRHAAAMLQLLAVGSCHQCP